MYERRQQLDVSHDTAVDESPGGAKGESDHPSSELAIEAALVPERPTPNTLLRPVVLHSTFSLLFTGVYSAVDYRVLQLRICVRHTIARSSATSLLEEIIRNAVAEYCASGSVHADATNQNVVPQGDDEKESNDARACVVTSFSLDYANDVERLIDVHVLPAVRAMATRVTEMIRPRIDCHAIGDVVAQPGDGGYAFTASGVGEVVLACRFVA